MNRAQARATMADCGEEERIPHCLVLPFSLQGHVNPMLQFSRRLRSKGLRITFVVYKSFLKTLHDSAAASSFEFPVEPITDGFDDGVDYKSVSKEIAEHAWKTSSESLEHLLKKLRSSGAGADCVIYDSFCYWVPYVAKAAAVTAAAFFTQSNSVNAIYFSAHNRELKLPISDQEIRISGGLPVMTPADLPSFVQNYPSEPLKLEIMTKQFSNVDMVDWMFVNTFYELEREVSDWMGKMTPTRPIGPTVPSAYTDGRISGDREYGLSAFKAVTDECTDWLDQNDVGSVVYVSFGSFARPESEQIGEIAAALKRIPARFLWVVRASEESKLPRSYREETSEKGLIVRWCNQLEVLSHAAVGCFVTHCGWNSTLEAICSGVPAVALPQWSDQFTNAKLVADVWGTGVRAAADGGGLVGEEEIFRCIKHVMEGAAAAEIRRRSQKWRKAAREAVDDGGSSDKNIQEFVAALINGSIN
ncbi:mogroside IE synthase-like [Andrographis paniculata]|uniref:mogroside IE synthase-like n=1 Tax=Andrographis paniculata TaxID=175694 RepID=UPI001E6B9735|nr:mogroside IE synthase-like [Andrographis paniculata]QZJ84688.1 UDP-glycosyltransferase 17 [Andrographis paniculata]